MSPEFKQNKESLSPPLTIRGHHVGDIARIVTTYTEESLHAKDVNGEFIPLTELYKYPDEGESFLQVLANRETVLSLTGYQDDFSFEIAHLNDYFGEQGIHAKNFTKEKSDFYKRVFLSSPDTVIEVNTSPDGICRGCQSTPSSEPGNHCMGFKKEDAEYVHVISEVLGNGDKTSLDMTAKVSLPVSSLRESEFIQQVMDVKERNYPSLMKALLKLLEE